jgi:hypothetical protein
MDWTGRRNGLTIEWSIDETREALLIMLGCLLTTSKTVSLRLL